MAEFAGRPVDGTPNVDGYEPTEQEDIQIFIDALDSLLDFDGVEAVKWTQYTPYFADGDACRFSVNEAHVKASFLQFDEVDEDDEDYDPFEGEFVDHYELFNYRDEQLPGTSWGDDVNKIYEINGVDTKPLYDALNAFNRVLENGAHWVELAKHFGDHAEIVATKDGFHIGEYHHD